MLLLQNTQRGLIVTYHFAQLQESLEERDREIAELLRDKLSTDEKAMKELKKKLVDNKASLKV